MFCFNCGKEIADKAVICVHCGVPTNNSVTERNSTSDKNWCVTFLLVLYNILCNLCYAFRKVFLLTHLNYILYIYYLMYIFWNINFRNMGFY